MGSEHANAKIAVGREADEALDRMVAKANEGFRGGKVTKADLATWLIQRFEAADFERSIEALRHDHFDQLAYLEAVVKEARAAKRGGGHLPNDLRELLAPLGKPVEARRRGRPPKAVGAS